MKSDWTITGVSGGKVFLEDLNLGRKSVTNDAENVVRDSEGDWDEMLHDNGLLNFP